MAAEMRRPHDQRDKVTLREILDEWNADKDLSVQEVREQYESMVEELAEGERG